MIYLLPRDPDTKHTKTTSLNPHHFEYRKTPTPVLQGPELSSFLPLMYQGQCIKARPAAAWQTRYRWRRTDRRSPSVSFQHVAKPPSTTAFTPTPYQHPHTHTHSTPPHTHTHYTWPCFLYFPFFSVFIFVLSIIVFFPCRSQSHKSSSACPFHSILLLMTVTPSAHDFSFFLLRDFHLTPPPLPILSPSLS